MITFQEVKKSYDNFALQASSYPEIENCMDSQFKDCVLVRHLGVQVPRDILPFCGKILKVTQLVFGQREDNIALFKSWDCIVKYLSQNEGVTVERYGLPPTRVDFPLSRSTLKGKNLTFEKVSFLDSSNNHLLEKVIESTLRFIDQSVGYSPFSENSLRMMLKGKDTLLAYSTTVEGRITAVIWGVKLQIQQKDEMVSCFYIASAGREPEYSGQKIYEKMIAAFHPFLLNEGHFKSDFLCWKQGKNNSINNNALLKFEKVLGEVKRSESESYTFEVAESCSVKLNQQSPDIILSEDLLKEALQAYAWNVGDFLTFAYEFPILMFKTSLLWNLLYTQEFPIPNSYQTSLQPIK